jgi:hypothetical protein
MRYLALLIFSLFAIAFGLLLLSPVAIVPLPLAVLAIVGLISPSTISRRPRVLLISNVGLIVVASFSLLVALQIAATKRRPVELVIDGPAQRNIRVVYGVSDGAPQPWSWTRRIIVPHNNLAFVQYADNGSWYSAANPHSIKVITRGADGMEHSLQGSWVSGGYTDAGACHFQYDEYKVGPASTVEHAKRAAWPETRWLDSLNTWGVECQRGKLVRSHSDNVPDLQRTGLSCYYLVDGTVACSGPPTGASPMRLRPNTR